MQKKDIDNNSAKEVMKKKAVIVIEDGVVTEAYTTVSDMQIEVVEMDADLSSMEERYEAYENLEQNSKLKKCDFIVNVIGRIEN